MTGDCCVFKFLRRSVDEKHLMRFQTKPPFSNSSGIVWTGTKNKPLAHDMN